MKKPSEQIRDLALSLANTTDVAHLDLPVIVKAMHQWLDAEAERAKPAPIVCPDCAAAGTKSKIAKSFRGGATMDLGSPEPKFLFDDDGREHFHDQENQERRVGYECAAGHHFTVYSVTPCWCGWGPEARWFSSPPASRGR